MQVESTTFNAKLTKSIVSTNAETADTWVTYLMSLFSDRVQETSRDITPREGTMPQAWDVNITIAVIIEDEEVEAAIAEDPESEDYTAIAEAIAHTHLDEGYRNGKWIAVGGLARVEN